MQDLILLMGSDKTGNGRWYEKAIPRAAKIYAPLESRARLDARLKETLASMPLDKMRKARSLREVAVAERLQVDGGSVSRLEGRSDRYLSTLREYVEAP